MAGMDIGRLLFFYNQRDFKLIINALNGYGDVKDSKFHQSSLNADGYGLTMDLVFVQGQDIKSCIEL